MKEKGNRVSNLNSEIQNQCSGYCRDADGGVQYCTTGSGLCQQNPFPLILLTSISFHLS